MKSSRPSPSFVMRGIEADASTFVHTQELLLEHRTSELVIVNSMLCTGISKKVMEIYVWISAAGGATRIGGNKMDIWTLTCQPFVYSMTRVEGVD